MPVAREVGVCSLLFGLILIVFTVAVINCIVSTFIELVVLKAGRSEFLGCIWKKPSLVDSL